MPRFQLKSKNQKTFDKVQEVIEGTRILRTQDDLVYGHWDFVVVGPSSETQSVIREGYAQQAKILTSPVYLTTLAHPRGGFEGRGIPIEELISEVPEDLLGLEVLQIDPVRPFSINSRRVGPPLKEAVDRVMESYGEKNIAIIQTPDEKYWGVSVLKYLNDFDSQFPDYVTEAIRAGRLPLKGSLLHHHANPGSRYYH